jgi:hypothetical protein
MRQICKLVAKKMATRVITGYSGPLGTKLTTLFTIGGINIAVCVKTKQATLFNPLYSRNFVAF